MSCDALDMTLTAKKLKEALQIGLDQARRGEFSERSVEEIWQKVKNRSK